MGLVKSGHGISALPDSRVTEYQIFLIESNYSNTNRISTMKKRILALGCMAALLAFSSDAFAVTGHATATIGTAISISEEATTPASATGGKLAFGHIIPSTGGTVTITPAGVVTQTGTITLTTQLLKGPAQFKVTGDAGKSYNITLDASTTISSGSNSMNVTALNSDSSFTLDGSGVSVFHVGGTLSVASGQAVGLYEGTFNVTAAYN